MGKKTTNQAASALLATKKNYIFPSITMYYIYYAYFFFIFGVYSYTQPRTPFTMAVYFLFCIALLPLFEAFTINHFGLYYSHLHPLCEKIISPHKTDKQDAAGIFQNLGILFSIIITAYFLFYVQIFEYIQVLHYPSFIYVTGYALCNQLIFDLIYSTAHKISHDYPFLYKYHKPHHNAHQDVTALNMGNNHWVETVIALSSAFVLPTILHHYYAVPYPFFGFVLHVTTKLCQHSACPYAPFLFNPLFDCFFKPTMHHNIHHVNVLENYYTIPFEHCIHGWKQDEDKYKKIYYSREIRDSIVFNWNPIHHGIVAGFYVFIFALHSFDLL